MANSIAITATPKHIPALRKFVGSMIMDKTEKKPAKTATVVFA
jgi:hypothetical protein